MHFILPPLRTLSQERGCVHHNPTGSIPSLGHWHRSNAQDRGSSSLSLKAHTVLKKKGTQLLGCMSASTGKALMSCHSAQTNGFSAWEHDSSPAPGHRQRLSSQWFFLVSSLSAEKASHAQTGPSPPTRSPTWGWGWSGAGDMALAGRRDASKINRYHHAGATLRWTGLFPHAACPTALPCTCHISKCKIVFLQGPDPAGGGTGWAGAATFCKSYAGLSRRESEDGKRQERLIAAMQ